MSNFSRFQERNKKMQLAAQELNSKFILNGYPAVEIVDNLGNKLSASVVNKEEQDYAYIYTNINDTLTPGTIWSAKNLHLLITKEITIIKDVKWHKYHAILCNMQIGDYWGYFKGPGKSFVEVKLEEKSNIMSAQKPVLVLPNNVLGFKDKIVLNNRPWLVQEYDNLSTEGVTYYSLEPTTMNKRNQTTYDLKEQQGNYIIKDDKSTNISNIVNNTNITLSTENGYFKSNVKLNVIQLKSSSVTFSIPYGINNVTVEVKEKGEVVSHTYTSE